MRVGILLGNSDPTAGGGHTFQAEVFNALLAVGAPLLSSDGVSSSMTSARSTEANVFTVTYWATLVAIALTVA